MFSTPSGSRSASPVSVDRSLPPAQSLSQGTSTSVYNANLMTSVMRPDPRYELALESQVPHIQTEYPDTSAVAVTQLSIEDHTGTPAAADWNRPQRNWLQQVEEDIVLSVGAAWIAGQDRSMWRTLRPSAGQAQQLVSE